MGEECEGMSGHAQGLTFTPILMLPFYRSNHSTPQGATHAATQLSPPHFDLD